MYFHVRTMYFCTYVPTFLIKVHESTLVILRSKFSQGKVIFWHKLFQIRTRIYEIFLKCTRYFCFCSIIYLSQSIFRSSKHLKQNFYEGRLKTLTQEEKKFQFGCLCTFYVLFGVCSYTRRYENSTLSMYFFMYFLMYFRCSFREHF